MGENKYKRSSQQGINLQNIPTAYAAQFKTNKQKKGNPIKKWAEDLNIHFSKKDRQMPKNHLKRCSTALTIREMQIKTTMRYHLTPNRMAIMKKSANNKC